MHFYGQESFGLSNYRTYIIRELYVTPHFSLFLKYFLTVKILDYQNKYGQKTTTVKTVSIMIAPILAQCQYLYFSSAKYPLGQVPCYREGNEGSRTQPPHVPELTATPARVWT